MKKIILLIPLFFFTLTNAYALEVQCQFEEVYRDGSNQQGIFFLDNNRLRYQYHNPQLYSLIYNNLELYAVQNNNTHFYQKVTDRYNIIRLLNDISDDFPDFQSVYRYNKQEVIVERSQNTNFIKRLVFKSDQLNLSIYFQNCKFMKIDQTLFTVKNFVKS